MLEQTWATSACNILRNTLEENKIDNVTVIEKGVADEPGVKSLSVPPVECGNHNPSILGYENGTAVQIEVTSLDQALQEEGVTQVDVLKIDVEGYEPNVIAGAHSYLQRGAIKGLLCEFNEYWLCKNRCTSQSLYNTILSYGFVRRSKAAYAKRPIENVYFEYSPETK